MSIQSVNPRTGEVFGPIFNESTPQEVKEIISGASKAFDNWSVTQPHERATYLRKVADSLDSHSEELVSIADLETGLGSVRLAGEVTRTSFQIRQFAEVLERGDFISPLIDAALDAPLPQGHPEFIRTTVGLGVVAIFGASNFPFAFSVLGGDTASALAAGCTVVAKAHPAHPQTSRRVYEIASEQLPADVLSLVHGFEAGKTLLVDQRVCAGAFTGSRQGGRALFDIANTRNIPIPFYGELGSVNPVVKLKDNAIDATQFATAYLDSLLLGNGQFCTNPSIFFVPTSSAVIPKIKTAIVQREGGPFLSKATKELHDRNRLLLTSKIKGEVFSGKPASDKGFFTSPQIFVAALKDVDDDAFTIECFGPTGLVLTYDSVDELLTTLSTMDGALVASLFATVDNPDCARVTQALVKKVGRVAFNAWPTGVAVTAGQNHGGPYPASTSPLHTSVGTSAITRFLRHVSFQSFPRLIIDSVATNVKEV